jgi:hypothetical protein
MNIVRITTLGVRQCAALLLLSLWLPQALHATSVLQVDMDQLLDDAAVIFEGEVIASEARWNADNTYISTWVTFRVDDVLKGKLPAATITQSFAGGTVGDTTLAVSGMVYPPVGETGIYFIENPERQQVNPMLGWSQGHFKVKQDSQGRERILTENDAPIQGIEASRSAKLQAPVAQDEATLPLSEGAAQGLRVGGSQDALSTAMDKQDFKNALRARLSLIEAANKAPEEADAEK